MATSDDLDHIIVKIEADVSDFRKGMKDATGDMDKFAQKGEDAGKSTDGLGGKTKAAGAGFAEYTRQVQAAYGITDPLSRSQLSTIKNLEQLTQAQKMSGAESAVYSALQKSSTDANSQAGRAISALALAQYEAAHAGEEHSSVLSRLTGGLFGYRTAATEAESGTKIFREGIHAGEPILREFGGQLGGLAGFASAARGGMAALAITAGGALAASLENAADKSRLAKKDLDALLGGSTGSQLFDAAKKSAEGANVSFDGTLGILRQIAVAESDLEKQSNFKFAPGAGGDEARAQLGFLAPNSNFVSAIVAMQEGLKVAGQNAEGTDKILQAMFASMIKVNDQTGKFDGLTAEAFQTIRQQAPEFANLLAKALNFGEGPTGAQNLGLALANGFKVGIPDVLRGVNQIKSYIDDLASHTKETLPQAFDEVTASWEHFETALADAGAFTVASKALEGLASGVHAAGDEVSVLLKEMDQLGGKSAVRATEGAMGAGALVGALTGMRAGATAGALLSPVLGPAGPLVGGLVGGIGGAVVGAYGGEHLAAGYVRTTSEKSPSYTPPEAFASTSGDGLGPIPGINTFAATEGSASQATGDLGQKVDTLTSSVSQDSTRLADASQNTRAWTDALTAGLIPAFGAAVPAETSFAQESAGAFDPLANAATGAAQRVAAAVNAIVQSVSNAISQMNSMGGAAGSGSGDGVSFQIPTDAGGVAAPANDMFSFATGGLTKVTGAGGTDSQLVQFMATPGEVVAVGNPKTSVPSAGSDSLGPLLFSVVRAQSDSMSSMLARVIATSPITVGDNMQHLRGFAEGGSFVVTGAGGVDSQLVQFKATPGEVVAVGKPGANPAPTNTIPASLLNALAKSAGQPTNLSGAATSVASSIANMNAALAAIAAKASAPATATPATSAASSVAAASGAGGGVNIDSQSFFQNNWARLEAMQAKDDARQAAAMSAPSGQSWGAVMEALRTKQLASLPKTSNGSTAKTINFPEPGQFNAPPGSKDFNSVLPGSLSPSAQSELASGFYGADQSTPAEIDAILNARFSNSLFDPATYQGSGTVPLPMSDPRKGVPTVYHGAYDIDQGTGQISIWDAKQSAYVPTGYSEGKNRYNGSDYSGPFMFSPSYLRYINGMDTAGGLRADNQGFASLKDAASFGNLVGNTPDTNGMWTAIMANHPEINYGPAYAGGQTQAFNNFFADQGSRVGDYFNSPSLQNYFGGASGIPDSNPPMLNVDLRQPTSAYPTSSDIYNLQNYGGGYSDPTYGPVGTDDAYAAPYDPYAGNDFGSYGSVSGVSDYGSYNDSYSDPYAGGSGSDNADYSDFGYYAKGGSFTVPGSGATDSVKAVLHLTPGENVSVGGSDNARKLGGSAEGGVNIENINFIGAGPGQTNWVQSRAQARRQIAAMF